MASKADVSDAYAKGHQDGCELAASEILKRLTALDAPPELAAVAVEVAQPDYFAWFDDETGEYRRDEIHQVKAARKLAGENHDKAVKEVFAASKRLREAAVMAAYFELAESEPEMAEGFHRLIMKTVRPVAENYSQLADRLCDETTDTIDQLLYTYRSRRLAAHRKADDVKEYS